MVALILRMNKPNYYFSVNSLYRLHHLFVHSSSAQTRAIHALRPANRPHPIPGKKATLSYFLLSGNIGER